MAEIRDLSIARAYASQDNSLVTPVQILREAAREIEAGEIPADKALIVLIETGDDGVPKFKVRWRAADIRASEIIAACEYMKQEIFLLLMEMD